MEDGTGRAHLRRGVLSSGEVRVGMYPISSTGHSRFLDQPKLNNAKGVPILGAENSVCKTIAPGIRSNFNWIIRGNLRVDRVELC